MILYFWNIKYQIDYMILNSHVLTFRWILPKNRPSNFAESWYNGSSSETIKIFQASLFIMLNLWSSANIHPFAISHIIMLLNKYLCHIIHWYSKDDSIYHKYIHLVILLKRKLYFHWLVTEYYFHYCTIKKEKSTSRKCGIDANKIDGKNII